MGSDDFPKYLDNLSKTIPIAQDNFDHTDVVWTGDDGALDADALTAGHGWDARSPLLQVVSALIGGQQPALADTELAALARQIEMQIRGDTRRGRAHQDDSVMLLEIARRYHRDHVEAGGSLPPLMPICEAVVHEYSHQLKHRGSDDNLPKTLARKFTNDRELWLARATTGDGYYAPQRMDKIRKISKALRLLQETDILYLSYSPKIGQ